MTQNLVSMRVTQEMEDEFNACMDRIDQIFPNLIVFEVGDRQRLTMAGPASDAYWRGTVELAKANAGLIPKDVDVEGAVIDAEARDRMLRISTRARKFASRCEDTYDAIGSDLMVFAQIVMGVLKVVGKAAGLEDKLKELGYRWRRKRKATPETEPGSDNSQDV